MKIKTCRECGVNYQTEKCPKCGSVLYTTWEALGIKGQCRISERSIWEGLVKKNK